MMKKILAVVLCLCLISGVSAMAADSIETTDAGAPAASGDMPIQEGEGGRSGMPGGGRGGFGVAPGEPPQGGEMPAPPEGEMTQPQNGNQENAAQQNNSAENSGQPQNNNAENNGQPQNGDNTQGDPAQNGNGQTSENTRRNGVMPGGQSEWNGNVANDTQNTEAQSLTGIREFVRNYSTPITSLILLALAFVFVIFYKRKRY